MKERSGVSWILDGFDIELLFTSSGIVLNHLAVSSLSTTFLQYNYAALVPALSVLCGIVCLSVSNEDFVVSTDTPECFLKHLCCSSLGPSGSVDGE